MFRDLGFRYRVCCLYYTWQLLCRLYDGRIARGPQRGSSVIFKVNIDAFMCYMFERFYVVHIDFEYAKIVVGEPDKLAVLFVMFSSLKPNEPSMFFVVLLS